jgi:ABC-2 type transport system ATP-binding protein
MADLKEHRGRLTRDLPLGWKQRLALGCAVLHEPPVLFLDEPTSGVDPISRRRFWDLIYALTERGVTVFVTTHYMEEAEYCQRLALMNRSRLIAMDTPTQLRARMHEPILELQTTNSPKAVEILKNLPGMIEAAMFGRAVHVVVEDMDRARATIPSTLKPHGITVLEMEKISPSLEDVFVSLVRAEGGAVLG